MEKLIKDMKGVFEASLSSMTPKQVVEELFIEMDNDKDGQVSCDDVENKCHDNEGHKPMYNTQCYVVASIYQAHLRSLLFTCFKLRLNRCDWKTEGLKAFKYSTTHYH